MAPIARPSTDPSMLGCLPMLVAAGFGIAAWTSETNTLLWGMIGALCFALGLWAVLRSQAKADARVKEWKARLLAKYGDETVVQMIVGGQIWQGQTEEQVVEALAAPVDVDEKVLKTKTKRIYKYQQDGKNRFRLRVTVENGAVVGWDKRN